MKRTENFLLFLKINVRVFIIIKIALQKDNNEQSITGNISNRIKPLCEIIPEEDEDKQKTGNTFFNRITKPMKGNSFIPYPVSKTFKQIHIKESPFGANYNNVVTPLGCVNIGTRQNNFEQSRKKETIAKLILPSSPYRTNRTPLDNNINIESPSTSEFTHDSLVKKISNDTKSIDDYTKERMHLFSAQYSYNIHLNKNNTIFPKGNRRPLSNLNNGGSNLYESIERKYNSKPCSQKAKLRNSKKDNILFKGNNSLFNSNDSIHFNDNKYSVSNKKFHKIKVERGMMSTKFVDTLINKLHFDLSTQTFKRGNILANSMNFIP